MNQHRVSAHWKGDMHFEAQAPGGNIQLDAATEVGGKGQGNRSKPLMLASLAGCTGMDVASLIKKMRIDVREFSIDVEGELTEEDPKIYNKVRVIYHFSANSTEKEKIEKAVKLSFEKYCGVIAMFKFFAKVSFDIQITQ